jgi:hypothetical protein
VTLTARGATEDVTDVQELELTKDPRLTDVSDDDLRAEFALASHIRDRESAANEAVIRIREIRRQVEERLAMDSLSVPSDVRRRITEAATRLETAMASVEREIYQVRNQSAKDKIAFPIRLNDRLTGLRTNLETGDARPTAAHERVFRELAGELEVQLGKLDEVLRRDLSQLNDVLSAAGLRPIVIPGATPTS